MFINFIDICRTMHRHQDHLYAYLLAELGTSGSIDGNYRLVLKGRFQPKGIENVLRRYIQEYVSCHSCKSPDTTLNKVLIICDMCCGLTMFFRRTACISCIATAAVHRDLWRQSRLVSRLRSENAVQKRKRRRHNYEKNDFCFDEACLCA